MIPDPHAESGIYQHEKIPRIEDRTMDIKGPALGVVFQRQEEKHVIRAYEGKDQHIHSFSCTMSFIHFHNKDLHERMSLQIR